MIFLASQIKKQAVIACFACDPDWIQTSDLLLRRQLLYSAELPDLFEDGKDKGISINF